MSDTATLPVLPVMRPPTAFTKPHERVPNLHPLPIISEGVNPALSARRVWRTWHELPKVPLIVTATLTGPFGGTAHLDSVLGAAVMRWAPAPWSAPGRDAWVVPLPLELLGLVGGVTGSKPPRLPVWASTPLIEETPGTLEALCIGHRETLEDVLSYLHEVERLPCTGWTVREAPLTAEEACEAITDARPMPGRDARFTPPYWFGWGFDAPTGASGAGKSGENESITHD